MSPHIEPWLFKKPVVLYALGNTIIKKDNGSRMINAYFVEPDAKMTQLSDLKSLLLPLGLLPILIPGYLYQNGCPKEPVQTWREHPVKIETFYLQNLQEAAIPYEMPFGKISSCHDNQDLIQAEYFHFLDKSLESKRYLIASSEIIRTFFAPNSNLLNFLYSEKFISDYVTYHPSSDCKKHELLLSDDTPKSFRGDSTLRWLYWLLSSDSAYTEWKSVKSAYQARQSFQAKIPFPLSGQLSCRVIPYRDKWMILSIKELNLKLPSHDIEVSLPGTTSIVSRSSATTSKIRLADSSTICGDSSSAHYSAETELSVQSFVFGDDLNIKKTRRVSKSFSTSVPHITSDETELAPLSVQDPHPHGTNPSGSLTALAPNPKLTDDCADPAIPSIADVKPGFESFSKVMNNLFCLITVSNIHARYFEIPLHNPLSRIHPLGNSDMSFRRREYVVFSFDYHGLSIAVLEIDTSDGKSISTLLFQCRSDETEAVARQYIKQLVANGGQWNRSTISKPSAILVRHCKYQEKSLYKYIQSLIP